MNNTLKLEIVTPQGLIFSGDAKSVTMPGSEGEFGVLPNHVALVTLLEAGVIDIELENGKHDAVAVNWGHVKVDENSVTVLADGAVAIKGDNESEIAKSLEAAKELLQSIVDSDASFALVTSRMESIAKTRKL